jgi:hypothetical protein
MLTAAEVCPTASGWLVPSTGAHDEVERAAVTIAAPALNFPIFKRVVFIFCLSRDAFAATTSQ